MSNQPTPEQIREMQEKIAKMSPEELKEFQKKQCIFCHIIAGKVQSKRIYEDETVLGILDINPANPGHVLLVPKEHYSILPQLPEDVMEHIFLVAKKLSNALLRCVDAQGSNILVANGVAAGQKAQHFMVHVIPRKEKDGVGFDMPQKQIPEDKLQEMAEHLAKGMGNPKPKKESSLFALPSLKKKMEEAEHSAHHERKDEKKKVAHKHSGHSHAGHVHVHSHAGHPHAQPTETKNTHPSAPLHTPVAMPTHHTPSKAEPEKKEKKKPFHASLDELAKLFGEKK
jgi:histidine triad (HIT) family protein